MSNHGPFDWYQLSKINQEQPDISKFSKLIKNAHFGPQISKVPNSLRQKLLISFQSASNTIKNSYFIENGQIEQLKFNKKVVAEQIAMMKSQVQNSIYKINSDKGLIEQKKKILTKLKQKVKKKNQKNQKKAITKQQVYFCPFCTKQDFSCRNQFVFHMHKQHSNNMGKQKEQDSSKKLITQQFKQFMLSLKDKQIQMVQMMLSKQKQLQTMELQKIFTKSIRKIKSQTNFHQRKSGKMLAEDNCDQQFYEQQQQLKGQSQYLFYQSQQRVAQNQIHTNPHYLNRDRKEGKQQIQKLTNPRSNISQPKIQPYSVNQLRHNYYNQAQFGHHPNEHRTYDLYQNNPKRPSLISPVPQVSVDQPKDYYNIFNEDIALSQVENSVSSHHRVPSQVSIMKSNRNIIQQSATKNVSQPINMGYGRSAIAENKVNYEINQNLSQKNQKQIIKPLRPSQTQVQPAQSKIYIYNNQTQSINSEKQFGSTQRQHQTVYMNKKQKAPKIIDGYIFNSGPLIDDSGHGQSDYQDYFTSNQNQISKDEVQDQQITVPQQTKHPNWQQKNMNAIKQMQKKTMNYISPQINSSKVSNYTNAMANQSNVALQYSKDKSGLDMSESKQKSSDLIQLSNSFSKRGLQSSKNNDQTINLSDLKFSKLEKYRQMLKEKQKDSSQINQMQSIHREVSSMLRPTYSQQNVNKSNSNILQQFKRDSEIQIRYQRNVVQKIQKPTVTYTYASTKAINFPQNIDLTKTNPGVLQQFLMKNTQV